MATYRLSKRADDDFESIYIYGVLTFGLEKAECYAAGLQRRFEQIAVKPLLYPIIDQVTHAYRRSVYGAHTIYYRLDDESVFIVRILRSQDPAAALSSPGTNLATSTSET
jgi:toxin ParE1/3/4